MVVSGRFLLAALILSMFTLMPVLDILFPAREAATVRVVPIGFKLIFCFCLVTYFVCFLRRSWFQTPLSLAILVIMGIAIFYYVFTSSDYYRDAQLIFKMGIWIFGYFFFHDLAAQKSIRIDKLSIVFAVCMVFLFLLVLSHVLNPNLVKVGRDYAASNFAYYLVFLLPAFFIKKVDRFRLLAIVLTSVAVAVSMKRGTMLLYACIFFYLFLLADLRSYFGKINSGGFRLSLMSLLVAIGFFLILPNMANFENKFSDLTVADDVYAVGSGRGLLYLLPLERWVSSNALNFLVGYGFNATLDFYPTTGLVSTAKYAHSDLIFFVYDYGLLGLGIWGWLFICLWRFARAGMKDQFRVPLTICFLCFFIKSLFSGFVNYEYSVYGMAVLGVIAGLRQGRNSMAGKNAK